MDEVEVGLERYSDNETSDDDVWPPIEPGEFVEPDGDLEEEGEFEDPVQLPSPAVVENDSEGGAAPDEYSDEDFDDIRPYFTVDEWSQLTLDEALQFKQQKTDYEYLLLDGEKDLEMPQFIKAFLYSKYDKGALSGQAFCSLCQKLIDKRHFNRHLTNLHILTKRTFECEQCFKKFKDSSALEQHIERTHRRPVFYCPCCYAEFKTDTELQLHRISTTVEGYYSCWECGQTFDSKCLLDRHVNFHDKKYLPFACLKCDAVFDNSTRLRNHQTVHIVARPYPCQLCDAAFKLQKYLDAHMDRCHSRKPKQEFLCCVCERPYSSRHTLLVHLKRRPFGCITSFPCGICDQVFKSLRLVEQHRLTSHIHPNMDSPYACQYCDYKTNFNQNLIKHTRIHTGERPFICGFCDKTFASESNRNLHEAVHMDFRKYQCRYCGKQFVNSSNFRLHEKTQHEGETRWSVWPPRNQSQITAEEYYEDGPSKTETDGDDPQMSGYYGHSSNSMVSPSAPAQYYSYGNASNSTAVYYITQ